ncbi:hypothetical protein Dimus_030317 [Dionaea muscipula]
MLYFYRYGPYGETYKKIVKIGGKPPTYGSANWQRRRLRLGDPGKSIRLGDLGDLAPSSIIGRLCILVHAFLDYYNIAYKVVEVNPINKKEIKWSDYKKVPILTVDGEQLVNFSDIIATLSERIDLEKSTGITNNVDEEREWLKYLLSLSLPSMSSSVTSFF